MSYSIVATWALVGTPSGTNTSSQNCVGADLIVAPLTAYLSFATTADSEGNTYSYTSGNNGDYVYTRIAYKAAPTVDSSMYLAIVAAFATIGGYALSGSAASPLDQQAAAGSTSATSLASGSITPTETNEFVITSGSFDASGTYTVDGSFTAETQLTYSSGNYFGTGMARRIQTSISSENATWSTSGSATKMTSVIASFKADGAPPSGSIYTYLTLLGVG